MTARKYQNFIGIDIGKFNFVVSKSDSKKAESFENNTKGFKAFHKAYKTALNEGLAVLETTGGYELELLLFLCKLKHNVHRANTRRVKAFVRSLGQHAKTDELDAHALALYAKERHSSLSLFTAHKNALKLFELAQGRRAFIRLLVQEKNRKQGPRCHEFIKECCSEIIDKITGFIQEIDQKIQYHIDNDSELKNQQEILLTIPGIGLITARNLICYMPEMGSLNQKEIAALAGVAPYANESGTFKGRRTIKGGRQEVRTTLFMAAMAATKSKSKLRDFYDGLVARGKKPIVALVAVMRKIIVIANARLKEAAYSGYKKAA